MQVYQKLAIEAKVIRRERYLESWEGRTPDRAQIGKHKENIAALLKRLPHKYGILDVRLELAHSDDSKMSFVVEYMHRAYAGKMSRVALYACEVRASLTELFTAKVWGHEREDGVAAVREYMILELMKEVDDGQEEGLKHKAPALEEQHHVHSTGV